MITHLDHELGRVVSAFEAEDVIEDTISVFAGTRDSPAHRCACVSAGHLSYPLRTDGYTPARKGNWHEPGPGYAGQ